MFKQRLSSLPIHYREEGNRYLLYSALVKRWSYNSEWFKPWLDCGYIDYVGEPLENIPPSHPTDGKVLPEGGCPSPEDNFLLELTGGPNIASSPGTNLLWGP